MQELRAPLQTAFSLGLQYTPLATAAIAAIERWESEQPQALRAVAPQIVPLLEPYLLETTALATDSNANGAPQGELCICCLEQVLCLADRCIDVSWSLVAISGSFLH